MARSRTIIKNLDPEGLFFKMLYPKEYIQRCKETRFKQHWKLSVSEYKKMLYGPKYQKGTIGHFQCTIAASAVKSDVFLEDETIVFENLGNICWAGVRFNSDGSIDERGPGALTYNQLGSGKWYVDEPVVNIGTSYEVRALSAGAVGTWNNAAAADDTWIQMDVDRGWSVTVISKLAPDVSQARRTFEIGTYTVNLAQDSGFFIVEARN